MQKENIYNAPIHQSSQMEWQSFFKIRYFKKNKEKVTNALRMQRAARPEPVSRNHRDMCLLLTLSLIVFFFTNTPLPPSNILHPTSPLLPSHPISSHSHFSKTLSSIRAPTPQVTIDQFRCALRGAHATGIEQRGRSAIIHAEIEVHVRT